jgi:hypothetical protein
MSTPDDDLSLLRELWGAAYKITFDGEMWRAQTRGTQSAVSAPTAAGLAESLADRRLMRPYPSEPPSDLREFLASCRLALPSANRIP